MKIISVFHRVYSSDLNSNDVFIRLKLQNKFFAEFETFTAINFLRTGRLEDKLVYLGA